MLTEFNPCIGVKEGNPAMNWLRLGSVASMIVAMTVLSPLMSDNSGFVAADETVTICDDGRILTGPDQDCNESTTTSTPVSKPTKDGPIESIDFSTLPNSDNDVAPDENRQDLDMVPGEGECPAEATMWVETRVQSSYNKGCSFVFNSVGVAMIPANCTSGYLDADQGDINGLWLCDDQPIHLDQIEGATWYPVTSTWSSPCQFYVHELAYIFYSGNEENLKSWVPMNFDCIVENLPGYGTIDTRTFQKPGEIKSTGGESGRFNDCGEIASLQDAVDLIGGTIDQWSDLGTGNGYRKLKFKGPKATPEDLGILLSYPGFGSFDTYTGSGQMTDVVADEATFNCPPAS